MALIEIELTEERFTDFVRLVVTASPQVPVPTLEFLGDDRLIKEFRWDDSISLVTKFAEYVPPAGTLLAAANLEIWHVSKAELRLDYDAPGRKIQVKAYLLLRAFPSSVKIALIGLIPIGGSAITLAQPIPIGSRVLPAATPTSTPLVAAALIYSQHSVTLRFATQTSDNLFLPAVNRLIDIGNHWAIWISGDFFVEETIKGISDNLTPPPPDIQIEDPPIGQWTFFTNHHQWGVKASVGVCKVNACLGIDLSVEINVDVVCTPNVDTQTINVEMRVSSDVSDWDSFRCWLLSGGIGSRLATLINPLAFLPSIIGTGIAVGEIIRNSAGAEVIATASKPSEFEKIAEGDDWVKFRGSYSLPTLPLPWSEITSARGLPDGILVLGRLPISLSKASHEITFEPTGNLIAGMWGGSPNCSLRSWDSQFRIPEIQITDEARVLGKHFAYVPVSVFRTSTAEALDEWSVDIPWEARAHQTVNIKCLSSIPGKQGLVILHTSAGIRCYTLGPIPQIPEVLYLNWMHLVNQFCDTFHELPNLNSFEITEFKWVEPPPDYNYGLPALQQWQLVIADLPAFASLQVIAVGEDSSEEAILAVTGDANGIALIEAVTENISNIRIRASGDLTSSSVRVRMSQRWLLPLQAIEILSTPIAMVRAGKTIGVLSQDQLISISTDSWRTIASIQVEGISGLRAEGERLVLLSSQGETIALDRLLHQVSVGQAAESAITSTYSSLPSDISDRPNPLSITMLNRKVVAVSGNKVFVTVPWRTLSTGLDTVKSDSRSTD